MAKNLKYSLKKWELDVFLHIANVLSPPNITNKPEKPNRTSKILNMS